MNVRGANYQFPAPSTTYLTDVFLKKLIHYCEELMPYRKNGKETMSKLIEITARVNRDTHEKIIEIVNIRNAQNKGDALGQAVQVAYVVIKALDVGKKVVFESEDGTREVLTMPNP